MEKLKQNQLNVVPIFKISDAKVTQKNKMIVFSLHTTHSTAKIKEKFH